MTTDTDTAYDVWEAVEGMAPEQRARHFDGLLRRHDDFLAARDLALTEVYLTSGMSFDDMANHFGRSATTIRTAVNRYKDQFPHLAGRRPRRHR